jgi:hypothetical protein
MFTFALPKRERRGIREKREAAIADREKEKP